MPLGVNLYDDGRLQERNAAQSDNVQIISPGVVTDGLVLLLDAGNYASYPASGTTWYNINGNVSNGTLTNGPTFSFDGGGSIVFDGTNDHITTSSYNYGNAITIAASVYPASKTTISTIFANAGSGAVTNGFKFFINTFNTSDRTIFIEFGNGSSGTNVVDSGRIVYNKWQQVVGVIDKDAASAKIYYNGALTASAALTITNFNTNAAAFIGAFSDGAYFYNGKMACVSVYNRALSPQEVEQNFNATRARFGI